MLSRSTLTGSKTWWPGPGAPWSSTSPADSGAREEGELGRDDSGGGGEDHFGLGLLASAPHHHLDMTQADREWWAANANGPDGDLDRHVDAMFAESGLHQ